jgi:predicted ester cyclase
MGFVRWHVCRHTSNPHVLPMKKFLAAVAVAGLASLAPAQSTPSESSKALVNRFWNEVWTPPYSMQTFDELVAEDFVITTDGKDVKGREAFKKWLHGFQTKVKDLKVVPQEILVTDDGARVITRMVASGKNNGMFGTKPDEAPIQFVAISIMEVKDGKLQHNWVERSAYELHQRLTAKKE